LRLYDSVVVGCPEIINIFSCQKTKGREDNNLGWLPYEYVLRGLAEDFWSILKKEWVDTTAFAE